MLYNNWGWCGVSTSCPEPVFKIIGGKIPVVPTESTFLRVESFLGYSAVFMKKERIFQKESTLYGNSYLNC